MQRRTAAVLLLLLILVGFVASFVLLRSSDQEDARLAAMSNRGRSIEVDVPERVGPGAKLDGRAILIAERGGVRFLRLPRVDGSSCWATSERRSGLWKLTEYGCETGFLRFPDPQRPVLVLGRLELASETGMVAYSSFGGFAADGVKRIGVVDSRDRVVEVTDVRDNVFYTPDPPQDAKAVVALDEDREVIWRGFEAQRQAE